MGFNLDGLSMGIQAIGRPRADLDVLRLAWAYEEATSWRT
jgi:amidase